MPLIRSTEVKLLGFNDIPPETRERIWEFSFPDRRLFHIKTIDRDRTIVNPTEQDLFFRFHIHHPPPAVTRVNKESRKVAMRKGFFLSEHGGRPGVWFNPSLDVLYFDNRQVSPFLDSVGFPQPSLPRCDRVLNVGIGWRTSLSHEDNPIFGGVPGDFWRIAILTLSRYMPNLQTVSYIVPKKEAEGGDWGGEAHNAKRLDAELVPLPLETEIPWRGVLNADQSPEHSGMLGDRLLMLFVGFTPRKVSWREIKAHMEQTLSDEVGRDEDADGDGETGPEITGCWLIRHRTPDKAPEVVEEPDLDDDSWNFHAFFGFGS